jgi:glycosyltransferase involved in cell wall biosynthesis
MLQKLNIFVIHPSDMITDHLPHGAGWIVYNYLRGLTERGHTVHAAAPRLEMRGPIPPRMHLHLIPKAAETWAVRRLSYIRAVRALFAQLSASVRFDIAQQFTPVETGLSLSVLGRRVPLILGPYSGHWPANADGPPEPESFAGVAKRLLRNGIAFMQQSQASALIITCPAAIQRIASKKARETRVHIISHGIDCRAYPERTQHPKKPSILFLANLEYRKGIYTLLDAFDQVAKAIPQCTLEIWGTSALAEQVEQRILESPFQDRIHRRGRAPRDKVGEIMRAHSVYCMPSHGEPFGMTLLEAMSSGVPIVTTDAGGPPHIVHDSGGRIVPMRDAGRLAAALTEILSSTALQNSMGAYNRKRVEEEFDWSHSLDRMESVYEQVLSHRSDRPDGHAPDTRWTSIVER